MVPTVCSRCRQIAAYEIVETTDGKHSVLPSLYGGNNDMKS